MQLILVISNDYNTASSKQKARRQAVIHQEDDCRLRVYLASEKAQDIRATRGGWRECLPCRADGMRLRAGTSASAHGRPWLQSDRP